MDEDTQPIVTPDACYEHFVRILQEQRPVTSQELIAQAYLGVMLYHVGMQMSILTRTLTTAMEEPEDDGDTTNGDTE
jgi:hypothetical protein